MNEHVYVDLLHGALLKYASKPCLHMKRNGVYQSWTFEEFHHDLNRLASILKKHGLAKGVNAVVIGENSPEWAIAYHAILLTGACTVPIDPNIPSAEIESIVGIIEAKIVFCSRIYLGLFRALKEKFSSIERIILLDTSAEEKEPRFDQYIRHGHENRDAFTAMSFAPDDPMVIIFTSGTTGRAKGVVLAQRNYTAVSRFAIPRMKVSSADTVLAVLPLHHVFGFSACLAGPLVGGLDVVFVPYVKGQLILEALQDKSVTFLPAVPKMISIFYETVLHNVKKQGPLVSALFAGMTALSATVGETLGEPFKRGLFSSVHKGFGGKLRLIISGGASLGRKYWIGFRQMGFTIVEGYGLTETFGPITVCPGDHPRPGSVGPVLPGNEITISEPNDQGIGEVLLRGSCVFKGYYKNDSMTAEVFDDAGWFHTGDLGRLDNEGFLYLSGRKKDMIVLDNGKNVYPDELEDHYASSPLIEEIGIFGMPQEEGGEMVAAAIVPAKTVCKTHTVSGAADLIYEELIRLGRELPVYRRISDFVIMYQPLPRTTTRKLKKVELRKLYSSVKRRSGTNPLPGEQLSVIEVALMETEEYTGVASGITIVAPHIDIHAINPRSHLEIDLGLDSLKRIELLSHIEQRFSIPLSEEVFDRMETVGDLVSLVKEQRGGNAPVSVDRVMDIRERILADLPDDSRVRKTDDLFTRALGPYVRTAASVLAGATVSDTERLRDLAGPLLLAANRISALDTFRILSALPAKMLSATFTIGDPETFAVPILPFLYNRNLLKLKRNNDPIEILKLSLKVIRSGFNLLIFPECQCTNPPKSIGQFKSGVGLLAHETGAPIVPVRVVGREPPGAEVRIIFGAPLSFESLVAQGKITSQSPPEAIADQIRTILTGM